MLIPMPVILIGENQVILSYSAHSFRDNSYIPVLYHSVQSVLKNLTEREFRGALGVIILDTWMIHGDEFTEEETDGGTFTGVCLYKRIREVHPKKPILILSTEVPNLTKKLPPESDKYLRIFSAIELVPSKQVTALQQLARRILQEP
jgi:hypothetical protein